MGKSRTLVYQIGRIYKLKGEYWQVIKTEDCQKLNGLSGQKVTLSAVLRPLIKIQREQQYR